MKDCTENNDRLTEEERRRWAQTARAMSDEEAACVLENVKTGLLIKELGRRMNAQENVIRGFIGVIENYNKNN